MDPFIWGFVRGGSATLAIGSPFLAAYAAYAAGFWYGAVFALVGLGALALFVVNEGRRP